MASLLMRQMSSPGAKHIISHRGMLELALDMARGLAKMHGYVVFIAAFSCTSSMLHCIGSGALFACLLSCRARPAVIHRDIKPENVLLTCKPGRLTAKLTDLGLHVVRAAGPMQCTLQLHWFALWVAPCTCPCPCLCPAQCLDRSKAKTAMLRKTSGAQSWQHNASQPTCTAEHIWPPLLFADTGDLTVGSGRLSADTSAHGGRVLFSVKSARMLFGHDTPGGQWAAVGGMQAEPK